MPKVDSLHKKNNLFIDMFNVTTSNLQNFFDPQLKFKLLLVLYRISFVRWCSSTSFVPDWYNIISYVKMTVDIMCYMCETSESHQSL